MIIGRDHASVLSHNHFRGFDDGVGIVSLFQLQILDRLGSDRGRDDDPVTDIDFHMMRSHPLTTPTTFPFKTFRALSFTFHLQKTILS